MESLILRLPQEMLECVVLHLDPVSSVNLALASRTVFARLEQSAGFWRHLARGHGLGTPEWCHETPRSVASWRNLYRSAAATHRQLVNREAQFPGQRILLDINSVTSNHVKNQDSFTSTLNLSDKDKPQSKQKPHSFKTLSRKMISDTIISHGLSEKYFVVIVSNCLSYLSNYSVWNVEAENIKFEYNLKNDQGNNSQQQGEDMAKLWVSCSEDVLVVGSLLVVLASRADTSSFFNEASPLDSGLLTVFHLGRRRPVAGWRLTDGCVRLLPLYLKDGGGSKLLHWGGLLLAVCPEVDHNYYKHEHEARPRLVLRVFSLPACLGEDSEEREEGEELELVAEHRVEGAVLTQPYSYMASDQKGPAVLLSFSQQCEDCISQQFVFLSLESKETVLQSIRRYDRTNLPR